MLISNKRVNVLEEIIPSKKGSRGAQREENFKNTGNITKLSVMAEVISEILFEIHKDTDHANLKDLLTRVLVYLDTDDNFVRSMTESVNKQPTRLLKNLHQKSLTSLLFEDKDYNRQQKVVKQSSLQEEWRKLWDI